MKKPTPLEAMIALVDLWHAPTNTPLAAKADAEIGAYVLLADKNWRAAPWWLRLLLPVMFWDHLTFDHLGTRFTVAEWRGQPFLIFVDEMV